MISSEQFESFFNQTLLPELEILEKERKGFIRRIRNFSFIMLCIAGAGAGIFFLFKSNLSDYLMKSLVPKPDMSAFQSMLQDTSLAAEGVKKQVQNTLDSATFILKAEQEKAAFVFLIIFLIAAIVIWAVVFFIRYNNFSKKFVPLFKSKIIQKIVTFIDKNLSYYPQNGISQSQYGTSAIFTVHPDRYKCEDMIKGELGKTQIQFSEVHSEYKKVHTDSKGRRRTTWHTIFKGLFFIADFNKNFNSRTVVLPDTMERLFGFLGQQLQSLNIGRDQLVKLEDPEFEKLFVVYGQDQIESRYILSTSLMSRIMEFRKKTNSEIYLSFVHSNVFVAIPVSKNLFEPNIFSSNLKPGFISEYFNYLNLTTGIVEDLHLNTRIWSKQ